MSGSRKKMPSMTPQPAKSVEDFIKGDKAGVSPASLVPQVPPVPVPELVADEAVDEQLASKTTSVGRPKNNKSKTQRSIHIEEEIRKQAEHFRIEHGLTMSALIEQALKEYIKNHNS